MTQYLGVSGAVQDGCASPGPLVSPSRRPHKPSGRGSIDGDSRNQCITDFFKPAVTQETNNGKVRLPHTGHLKKAFSSPKKNRRKKIPFSPSQRSPIIDAFFKTAKSEKKDSPCHGVHNTVKTMRSSDVVRKLFISNGSSGCSFILKDNACTKNLERNEIHPFRARTPLAENGKECKMDYMELGSADSNLSKWASTAENSSLKRDCSGQKTHLQERKTKDTADILRKRSCSTSWESSSDESSSVQTSQGLSSEQALNRNSNVKKSYPSVHPNSMILEISKHKECPEKQKKKHVKLDTKNSQKSTVERLDNHRSTSSLGKHISDYSKVSLTPGDSIQVKDKHLPDYGLCFPAECLNAEEEKDNSYNCTVPRNYSNETASTKKNQFLEKSQQQVGVSASGSEHIVSPKHQPSKKPKIPKLHIQNNLFERLETKLHKQYPKLFISKNLQPPSATCKDDLKVEETCKNLSTLPSEENPELSSLLLGESNNVLLSEDQVTPSNSLQASDKLNNDVSEPKSYILNKKHECLYGGVEETSNCSVDDSDDDELVPLEQILASSAKQEVESAKQGNNGNSPMDTTVPSCDACISKGSTEEVSFMNHLDHLLKEREELRRIDELEQQLQQVKQQVEKSSLSELQSNDGKLSAEHRKFLEKFSIISNAIPDQHPGEDIFQISQAGKIFNQHNLDLRNFGFHPQNPIEKYLLGSGIKQQLFVITEGLLKSAYHNSSCPVPILKWMFQMMSIHPDNSVSRKILDMLMTLTIRKASAADDQQRPWIPSLFDIATNLINMGIPFSTLFPLREFQPIFSEDDIKSETYQLGRMQPSGNIFGDEVPFFVLIDTNLCNMAKFLRLCVSIYPEGYTDREIFQLLLLLFKLSLEKMLKKFPLVDLQCLIIKLLDNIREWDSKMSELCLAINCLSNHHHDLLWLVQFVPNWVIRGRQVRRHLSLIVISKFLKKPVNIPKNHEQQMLLLCKDLVEMKPSSLVKKVSETVQHDSKECLVSNLEPEAYYLTYVLLHLVREASDSEITNSNQRKLLLKLCTVLEKHVKCDIREDVRLFYKTKVKDLVARIYSKWQQMIHSSRLTQGQIHDFWVPDS